MRAFRTVMLTLLAIVVVAVAVVGVKIAVGARTSDERQHELAAFYVPPDPLPQELGTVIRSQPLGVSVPGATAYRLLYVSETAAGVRAASGAMIFIPTGPAPSGGRPVVAWAHGRAG
jgi:hypothetical protein